MNTTTRKYFFKNRQTIEDKYSNCVVKWDNQLNPGFRLFFYYLLLVSSLLLPLCHIVWGLMVCCIAITESSRENKIHKHTHSHLADVSGALLPNFFSADAVLAGNSNQDGRNGKHQDGDCRFKRDCKALRWKAGLTCEGNCGRLRGHDADVTMIIAHYKLAAPSTQAPLSSSERGNEIICEVFNAAL